MCTFKSEFIDGKKNILIPALQRDYVQGGRTDVINPFIDELLSALKGDKKLDLNYIYGSYEGLEKNDYVPIDGQQRLITLWLVYLYLYKKQGSDFQVKLRFNSREFANAFSEKLLDKLQDFINSKELKNEIIDAPWFVSGWQYDVTVCNMLNTLGLLAERCKEVTVSEYQNYDNISFSFLDIKSEGLTDDIYVKMNGRGKPLTYFENLKSWMDGTVIRVFKDNPEFVTNWQTKIDNEWTDFFWENRNRKQGHPEEIDDEQTSFFYSLLLMYWIKNEDNLLLNISDDKINGLNAFLGLSEDNKDNVAVKNKIFEILREGKILIPLYWIEGIGLYNKDVFEFVFKAFAKLCYLNSEKLLTLISSSHEYLDLDVNKSDETTLMYKLSMSNATYTKTLPYLYALIQTPELCKNDENFKRWIRLIRNLVVNSTIWRDNLAKVCNCIDTISKSIKQDFYASISNLSNLDGFEKDQLNEEKAKAQQILNGEQRSDGKTWEEIIIEAENYAFFKGAIRFLFLDGAGGVDWDKFDEKYKKAQMYFKEKSVPVQSAMNRDFDNAKLLKALISRFTSENFWDVLWWHYRVFNNFNSTWRYYLLNKNIYAPIHEIMMGENNIKEKKGNQDDDAQNRLYQLSNTNLLDYVIETIPYSWIRKYHNHIAIFPSAEGIFLDAGNRDILLYELHDKKMIELSKDSIVPNTHFLFGTNINFKYKQKFFFQWYGAPNETECDVYLMEDDWGNYKPRSNPTTDKGTDEDKYYCFSVSTEKETDTSFTKKLNELIAEASSEE